MRRYRNHEGYPDPTAGQAMENISRSDRRRRKAALQAEETQTEVKPRRQRYVNHPKNRRYKQ